MIKIRYAPLSSQPAHFNNEWFSREDEYLQPTEQDVVPVTTEYNGETYRIQHIIYDAYTFNVYLRDSELTDFQNIQSSSKIILWEIGNEKRFNGQEFEFIEQNIEGFANEFWKLNVKVRYKGSKVIENIIDEIRDDVLGIIDDTYVDFYCTVNFPPKLNGESATTYINDIKSIIPDFSKVSKFNELRFYLNGEDYQDMITSISKVSEFSVFHILYKSVRYKEYTYEHKEIGNNLFEISLKLFSSNEIIVPGT